MSALACQKKVALHSEDQNSLVFSLLASQAHWQGIRMRLKVMVRKRLFCTSLLLPCRIPGRLRIACVHAGRRTKFFLTGKISLQISLPTEFVVNRYEHKV